MTLLNKIIDEAADDGCPLPSILRKCLTLAYDLNNERLKDWLMKELYGYNDAESVPEYRLVSTISKGLFLGPFGSSIDDQPLPLMILHAEHRKAVSNSRLTQPVGSYLLPRFEDYGKGGSFRMDWPPDLTAIYQNKFYQGYALNRAYIEIPVSAILSLMESVRTRVLQFALEIRQELGVISSEDVEALPHEKVNSIVNNYIYGGQNVIGSQTRDVQQNQTASSAVEYGNGASLKDALRQVGLDADQISQLDAAIQDDRSKKRWGDGSATHAWIATLKSNGLSVGLDVAKTLIVRAVSQYLGMPPS